MPMQKFYDVKTKKSFTTDKYRVVQKGPRNFIVAKSPMGTHESWKSISRDMATKLR